MNQNSKIVMTRGMLSVVCVMAGLSGMAGLAHQVVWTRRLVDLLGASPLTFSKVVGAFFVGLAIGSAFAAIRSGVVRQPWRLVACVELCVAVFALPVLFTPQLAELLYRSPQLAAWLKHLVPFLFVMPPAIAMGLVIPWMLRALSGQLADTSKAAVWLYAANTLGGVAGIGAVMLFALPTLGLTGTGLAVCGLNVSVALIALWLDRVSPSPARSEEPIRNRSRVHRHSLSSILHPPSILPSFLAFSSGFLVLALEVVLQHQFAQVTINSLFSTASVLAWGLLSLSAGAALAMWLGNWSSRTRLQFILLSTAACCAVQPSIFTWMRGGIEILPYELQPAAYTWEVAKLALVSLCPLFVVAGMLFPTLLREFSSGPASSIGRNVAVLLAWNGLGGWLGSEVAQNFITPKLGLWQSVVLLGLGYLSLAILTPLFPRGEREINSGPVQSVPWLALPAGVAIAVAFVSAASLPQVSLNPEERLLALEVGREGVVATVDCGPGDRRMLFNNSYTLGGSKARANQERQAHLPILLHGHARSVAVMGVATGGTVAGVALHPGVERIDAAELSPIVLDQAEEFFGDFDRNLFRDARVHLFAEDARWMIATHERTYDVVVGDLFLPWRTGEGRLFSVEHFQAVRRSLKPGGVFCQWLPLFQLTRPQFDAIARSFQQVFPDAIVVRGDFYTELPILGLVGGLSLAKLNWQQIGERCDELRADGQVTDPLVRHKDGVAMLIVGMLPDLGEGPINTLGNAWLEWDCGKNIVGLQKPWFIGVPEAEFVRDVHRTALAVFPPDVRAAHDAGQFFLTLEIAARLKLEVYPNLYSQLNDRLPFALREDRNAEWQTWPSRVKPQLDRTVSGAGTSNIELRTSNRAPAMPPRPNYFF